VDFHPTLRRAYVVNELDSTVTTYDWGEDGSLEPMQTVPSVPSSFTGENTGSGVVVSRGGRLLFASNRGHDSVGVFGIDPLSGLLSAVGWEASAGATPRFIGLSPSGARLFAANQNGDSIVSWSVDERARRLTRTANVVEVGCPTAIAFVL
jgi:6-phosphogluconolactonase (cycloisomerase 2 family)